ncbi:MAG: hypothetical protein MZV70_07685 [Desulfobacterales bacterium]|nr:hypothetical protein [Desulfobacterales bacterium]
MRATLRRRHTRITVGRHGPGGVQRPTRPHPGASRLQIPRARLRSVKALRSASTPTGGLAALTAPSVSPEEGHYVMPRDFHPPSGSQDTRRGREDPCVNVAITPSIAVTIGRQTRASITHS